MDPPPLNLGTRAEVSVVPQLDEVDGASIVVVLIKERFVGDLRQHLHRAGGATIRLVDEPWDPGNPETSSIRYPSDLCQRKPSTDVVVVGSAMAPARRPVPELDVSVEVGPIQKRLRVFGPRAWSRSGRRMVPTAPQPFEEVPVTWERAWGGTDFDTDPQRPVEEPRNPSGTGVTANPSALEGTAVPSVEDPDQLLAHDRTWPRPAGFGALGRHWAPRREYTGTFDDKWLDERMPLLPLDFDPRFNHVVAPDQVAPRPFRGGERVDIRGMNERGSVRFELPRIHFFVGVQTANGLFEQRPQIDTVLLEPNVRAVEITWRSTLRLPRRAQDTRFVQVHEKRRI